MAARGAAVDPRIAGAIAPQVGLVVLAAQVLGVSFVASQLLLLGVTGAAALGAPAGWAGSYLGALTAALAGTVLLACSRGLSLEARVGTGVVLAAAALLLVGCCPDPGGSAEGAFPATLHRLEQAPLLILAGAGVAAGALGRATRQSRWWYPRPCHAVILAAVLLDRELIRTAAVPVTGMLLVWGMLAGPAAAAALARSRGGLALTCSWVGGALATTAAMAVCLFRDLPLSLSAVCALGYALIIEAMLHGLPASYPTSPGRRGDLTRPLPRLRLL